MVDREERLANTSDKNHITKLFISSSSITIPDLQCVLKEVEILETLLIDPTRFIDTVNVALNEFFSEFVCHNGSSALLRRGTTTRPDRHGLCLW